MKIINCKRIIKDSLEKYRKWSVLLWIDMSLYELVRKGEGGENLPSYHEYVEKVFPENHIQVALLFGHSLFTFDWEDEATEFFKRVPEGSLINAELYSPDGEFQSDNT